MQHQGNEDPIVSKYGSYTNYYRTVAKETGTTPDQVMEQAEKMMNPQMQQNSLGGANAQTPVSQVANGPTPVNPQAVQAQSNGLQAQGIAPSQAQNAAATNPANAQMAKGGSTSLPDPKSKPELDAALETSKKPTPEMMSAAMGTVTNAIKPAKGQAQVSSEPTKQSSDPGLKQFDDALNTVQLEKQGKVYAKGGPVSKDAGDLKLKEILQLLATHPSMSNQGSPGQGMKSTDMSYGGGLNANSDPDMKGGAEGRSFGPTQREGLLSGFAAGGPVEPSNEVENNDAGAVHMDSGGTLESDQITGYGPDGTPIIQNPDGSVGYGDINQLLGRPESASTLGTGQTPGSQSNQAANAPLIGMAMAKGGEDTPASPPGSLGEEVADQIPAQLSPGEFVMSADATRFWGLQKLTMMQDFARQELAKMDQSGKIRSPGDGQNPQGGNFMQDQQPNQNFYSPQDKGQKPDTDDQSPSMGAMKGGPINYGKNKGGLMGMSTGGGTTNEEEQFSRGGPVRNDQYGRNNMVSSHPQGGSVSQDYDKGGIVSSQAKSLSPMKQETSVPTKSLSMNVKQPRMSVEGPHVDTTQYGQGKYKLKAKKGGLLRDVNQTQSYTD